MRRGSALSVADAIRHAPAASLRAPACLGIGKEGRADGCFLQREGQGDAASGSMPQLLRGSPVERRIVAGRRSSRQAAGRTGAAAGGEHCAPG